MPRKIATNAELTKMINDRFREGRDLDGDCREVRINGVQLYREPDETGCNWNASFYNGPDPCRGVFRIVIDEFRGLYNLSEDAVES